MRLWTICLSHFRLGMALVLWVYVAEVRAKSHCPTDYCSRQYTKAIKNGLVPGDSSAYCQLVVETLACVKQLIRHCSGNLIVKSQLTGFNRQHDNNNCAKYNISPYHRRSTCPAWPEHHPGHQLPVCSIFGFEHLRTFSGTFATCNRLGATTLVENPFFIIQVSTNMVKVNQRLQMPAVTKIVLLIRNLDGCIEGQRTYEASIDDRSLPTAFTDGTSNDSKIGITVHSESHVDISLNYLNTTLHFRRAQPHIGVTISMPLQLYHLSSENPQLCQNGCPTNASFPMPQILANPSNYIEQCTALDAPLTPIDLATQQCTQLGTVGDFHAVCLFDHYLGDHRSANMIYKIQTDVSRSAHVYTDSFIMRKSRLETSTIAFDCVKPSFSSKLMPSWRLLAIIAALYLIL